jgi:hypothetical protein
MRAARRNAMNEGPLRRKGFSSGNRPLLNPKLPVVNGGYLEAKTTI